MLLADGVDFGASDSPEVIHELAPTDEEKYLFFPSVVGAVVPVVNLPGLSNRYRIHLGSAGRYLPRERSRNGMTRF